MSQVQDERSIEERLLDSEEYAGDAAVPGIAELAAAEIRGLRAEVSTLAEDRGALVMSVHEMGIMIGTLLDSLETMFEAYEDGPDCYEDPDDCAGHLGKAVKLDAATADRIAGILNQHRPRDGAIYEAVSRRANPEEHAAIEQATAAALRGVA